MPCRPLIVVKDDASMGLALERLLNGASWKALAFSSVEALLQSDVAATAECFIFDPRHLRSLTSMKSRSEIARTTHLSWTEHENKQANIV